MLHINNACIAFGTEVLFSGFNMKLERGETACIVGQSGCGKNFVAECGDGVCTFERRICAGRGNIA